MKYLPRRVLDRGARTVVVAAATLLLLAGCEPTLDPGLEAGRRVFLEVSTPACSTCHSLAQAAATAQIGPDLDRLRPDSSRVSRAVSGGLGIMPAQKENLTARQIAAVARYVSEVAGH